MDSLTKIWKDAGLKNEIVFIQSNVVNTIKTHKCSVKDILDSILSVVDTAVFPAFNVESVSGDSFGTFDIRTTPSKMGVLTETARLSLLSVRSGHPMFSFTALGKHSHLFDIDHFSGYGRSSPFKVLRNVDGFIGILGLENDEGNSMIHHAEELELVPYRKYKVFTGNYTDHYGLQTEREYCFYCNGGYKTLLNPLDEIMWEKGLYRGTLPYQGNGFRTIKASDEYDCVVDVIRTGKAKGILYVDC